LKCFDCLEEVNGSKEEKMHRTKFENVKDKALN